MTNPHPITPPPELLQQWATEYWGNPGESIGCGEKYIATQAARWGADQELEACCAWLDRNNQWAKVDIDEFRAARRPKPPSLKEQALDALREAESTGCLYVNGRSDLIRKALEALPND